MQENNEGNIIKLIHLLRDPVRPRGDRHVEPVVAHHQSDTGQTPRAAIPRAADGLPQSRLKI